MAGENKVRPKIFFEWCENFWYHYKYHTIVAIITVAALTVMIAQCASKTDYDYSIVIATDSVELAPAQLDALNKELSTYCKDLNGDGEVNLSIIDCSFNSKTSSYQVVMAKKQKLQSVLMNEQETMLIISDKSCYEWINKLNKKGFMEDLNLSDEDGRYFKIDNTSPIINAKNNCHSSLTWPEDLRISRRRLKDTLFENKEKAQKAALVADEYIQEFIKQNS